LPATILQALLILLDVHFGHYQLLNGEGKNTIHFNINSSFCW